MQYKLGYAHTYTDLKNNVYINIKYRKRVCIYIFLMELTITQILILVICFEYSVIPTQILNEKDGVPSTRHEIERGGEKREAAHE